jgi:cytochrome c oxidase accessory protein FixG
LIFVLATLAFSLFFFTSVWGRVWCGWACPQTVFIEGVFRRIERLIEGSAIERRKLADAPLTWQKILRKAAKWVLFLAGALIISHSFLAYFVGVDRLAQLVQSSPFENPSTFVFMAIVAGLVLFNFAWFREQFCVIVCPYGRFQSVLMDPGSRIVAYDAARGEPRATPQAKALARAHSTATGDCVNCYRCVQVCPVGIDIRRGTQMECIACTACIDACDEVMTKLGKPPGLVRYDTQRGLEGLDKKRIGSRSLIYLGLASLSLLALVVSTSRLAPVELEVLRAKDAPYTVQGAGANGLDSVVTNHFVLELSNQSGHPHRLFFDPAGDADAIGVHFITAARPYALETGRIARVDLFVQFPKKALVSGKRTLRIRIRDEDATTDDRRTIEKEVVLVGPFS